jgi:CRISPR-associated protein Csd2
LWDAILNMFENDHSAARGNMAVRKLIIFKHDSELGNAPAHKLFDAVTVERKKDVRGSARRFADYTVAIDTAAIPAGVNGIDHGNDLRLRTTILQLSGLQHFCVLPAAVGAHPP